MSKCDYCQHVEMCRWRKEIEDQGCEFFGDAESEDKLFKRVNELPSATVQKKVGEWKRVSMDLYTQHATAYYKCSKCGNNNIGASNYCPNCGARMVEPQDVGRNLCRGETERK